MSHKSAQKTDVMQRRARVQVGRRAQLRPIGVIQSNIKKRSEAPMQGSEGAPTLGLK